MTVNLCTRIIVFSRLSQSSANPNRVEYGSRVFLPRFFWFHVFDWMLRNSKAIVFSMVE